LLHSQALLGQDSALFLAELFPLKRLLGLFCDAACIGSLLSGVSNFFTSPVRDAERVVAFVRQLCREKTQSFP
jgi:hypothetical protein